MLVATAAQRAPQAGPLRFPVGRRKSRTSMIQPGAVARRVKGVAKAVRAGTTSRVTRAIAPIVATVRKVIVRHSGAMIARTAVGMAVRNAALVARPRVHA
ncbi:hypothetical protein GCM10010970_36100 [Silvimonas iriomotensis]|uniref:Uncharacterized protein n=1 Tax=Silvimonas iriomotensis TaxID=449662 RepID=A0ABQ2PEL2_9NEIS|nr:hypothetical protein GCM10010970_36100 [Silvimonas iriomotensis]